MPVGKYDEKDGKSSSNYESSSVDYKKSKDSVKDNKSGNPFEGLIQSVGDAERLLKQWNPDDKETLNVPGNICLCLSTRKESSVRVFGTADEYRSLASEFDRRGRYEGAEFVASVGAEKWPGNIDLLADLVKYATKVQDWETGMDACKRLKAIEIGRWNWQTFRCVYDYLMARMESDRDPGKLNKELDELFSRCRKFGDERVSIVEAEHYLKSGDSRSAIKTLMMGVENNAVSTQCSIKLVELLLRSGQFDEAVRYAAMGLQQTDPGQSSASIGYLVYLSALAKDAMIFSDELWKPEYQDPKDPARLDNISVEEFEKQRASSGFHDLDAVRSALEDYSIAADLLKDNDLYRNTIAARMLILKTKSGIA